MAGGIDVKMGVTGLAQYKQGMAQAQQSVKTLDAALKLNEKQLQATGDKETYMANKSKLLKQQIAEQNTVVKQGQAALAAMEKQGISPASAAYQKMQQQVLNAQAALLDMNGDLNTVGQSADETAQKTDRLTNSLNGINKKVSFDAVLNGIGKITDTMEAAARKVESLARDVWDTMAMAASWADDETTLAQLYGIDVETLQKMQKVAENEIQTPVEAIIKAKQKLAKELSSGSKEVQEDFEKLGLGHYSTKYDSAFIVQEFSNEEEAMWAIGEALMNYNNELERDAMAQKYLGRSWMEMRPLFDAGREAYKDALEEQTVVSEENVGKLNELSGAMKDLKQDAQTTGYSLLAEMAPGFTELSKGLSGLLKQFNEYLETPEGKEKLGELSGAVTELFSGLSDADFGTALDAAESILDDIIEALGWIKDNKDGVVGAIKGIGWAFLGLKAAEVVGTLAQGAVALKNLLGTGGATAGGAAAGGASTVGAAASATATAVTTGSKLLDALGIGALFKTAMEASEKLGTGLYGELYKKQQMKEVSIAGYIDPVTGDVYSAEEWKAIQEAAQRPVGEPKRTRNITGTASEESMQGYVIERAVDDIYSDLYKAINDYDPETNAQDTTQFFDNVLYPLIQEAGKAGGIIGDSMNEIADLIYDKWIQSLFDDEWEGTTDGLLNILQEAIDEKAQGLTVETTPVLPENAADLLQSELSGVTLHVTVIPDLASVETDGSHANGLPFVPFDGYIAALHRGERVVPAAQNRNYTNTSNVYFDHVNVNNGIDADGLAAKIAERTKHTLAGFGG